MSVAKFIYPVMKDRRSFYTTHMRSSYNNYNTIKPSCGPGPALFFPGGHCPDQDTVPLCHPSMPVACVRCPTGMLFMLPSKGLPVTVIILTAMACTVLHPAGWASTQGFTVYSNKAGSRHFHVFVYVQSSPQGSTFPLVKTKASYIKISFVKNSKIYSLSYSIMYIQANNIAYL